MGTVIYEKQGIQVKRFYGGDQRGICYQITTSEGYVQLTEKQFKDLLKGCNTETFFLIRGSTLLCRLGLHKWVRYILNEGKDRQYRRMCLRCAKKQELAYDFLCPFWADLPTKIIYGLP